MTVYVPLALRTTVGVSKTCAVSSTLSIAPRSKNAASAIVAYSSAVSAALAAPLRMRYSSHSILGAWMEYRSELATMV